MAEIVPALSRALDAELPGIVERSGVVDRETWVHANVATFAGSDRQGRGRAARAGPSARLGPGQGRRWRSPTGWSRPASSATCWASWASASWASTTWRSSRPKSTPGRLLFVDENIRRTAAALDVPLNPFRTWIALHETTHAFEFEAHPWLRPYLAERLERQLRVALDGVSTMSRDAARQAGPGAAGRRHGRALDGGADDARTSGASSARSRP